MVRSGVADLFKVPWFNLTSGERIVAGSAVKRSEYVHHLGELAASGKIVPVIDRSYSFDEIADAHRYVDQGHKRGSVVISLEVSGNNTWL